MMIVITMTNCPPKLRGDLSRWLIEIDTNVFVGNLSARVRDAIWNRVCENIKNGKASMAFSTNGEQKLDFRIHNTEWEPIDFDGVKLVRRNYISSDDRKYKETSKAQANHINRLAQRKNTQSENTGCYAVIDIETTGLKEDDEIIELGAVLVENGEVIRTFSAIVKCSSSIPDEVSKLTGIDAELIAEKGIPLKNALEQFLEICGSCELIGHNINFDIRLLHKACINMGFPVMNNKLIDTMKLSRRKFFSRKGYSLSAVAEQLGIEYDRVHRALDDCLLTYRIYEKLNEK